MAKRKRSTGWAGIVARNMQAMSRLALRAGRQAVRKTAARVAKPAPARRLPAERAPARGAGDWLPAGALRPRGKRPELP